MSLASSFSSREVCEMARTRKSAAALFDAITLEGNLITPAMLTRIAAHESHGQSDADYGVPKGLTLRDEIARYFRIGQALFHELFASPTPSSNATVQFTERLLREVFGFHDLNRVGHRELHGRSFAVTLEALGGRVPIVVVPPSDELDRPSTHLQGEGRRRSAASAVQEWLNACDSTLWGLCCNGNTLRLVRDNASLTRPAYVEANLRQLFEAEDFADFAALWLLIHVSRFGCPQTNRTARLLAPSTPNIEAIQNTASSARSGWCVGAPLCRSPSTRKTTSARIARSGHAHRRRRSRSNRAPGAPQAASASVSGPA